MYLSIVGGSIDSIIDHGQQVGYSSHFNIYLNVRGSDHLVHFSEVIELSLDVPQLTESSDIVFFELSFEQIDLIECFFDFMSVNIPGNTIGKEQAIEKTMRFN